MPNLNMFVQTIENNSMKFLTLSKPFANFPTIVNIFNVIYNYFILYQ